MLAVKRPTETTVLYTVSTRSPATTWASRAGQYALLLVRLVAAAFILVLAFAELNIAFNIPATIERIHDTLDPTFLGQLANYIIGLQWPYRAFTVLVLIYGITTRSHTSESLLVVRGLGVQTSTSSASLLWSSSTRFIPTSSIQDIFIHEAFKGFEVKYYLSIVMEGEEGVVVVFPSILPRRQVLEEVWRGTRACLYEPKG